MRALFVVVAGLTLLSGCNCGDLVLAIVTQPADQSVVVGDSATFTVVANKAVTGYRWQQNDGSGFQDIAGATDGTFHTGATTLAMSGRTFRVIVSGTGKSTLTSNTATLTVTSAAVAPAITTGPADQQVTAPATATFTVVATGTSPLQYQWQRGAQGTFTDVAGATSASYTTPATSVADSGATFRVVVTNSAGSVTSAAATLTVVTAQSLTITSQPMSVTVAAGQPASFTVAATGNPAPTYQWRRAAMADAGFTDVAGETSTTLTLSAVSAADDGAAFDVLVANDGGSLVSATATLTVQSASAPLITSQPADVSVDSGTPATFTVVATGVPAPTYQWRDAESLQNLDGGTSASFTLANPTLADDGRTFDVVVKNASGQVTSNTATLHVSPAPLTGFTDVSTSQTATVALKNGQVWTWGTNNYGQLGRPSGYTDIVPTVVPALTGNFIKVLERGQTTFAVRDDGTVWTWGSNASGELGNPSVSVGGQSATPVQVVLASNGMPLTGIVGIEASDGGSNGGQLTVLAWTATGALFAWGSDFSEPGLMAGSSPTPRQSAVANPYFDGSTPQKSVKKIALGIAVGLAILGDDTVVQWVRYPSTVPTTVNPIAGISGTVVDIGASNFNAYVVPSDNSVWDVFSTPVSLGLSYPVDKVQCGVSAVVTVVHRKDTGQLYVWGTDNMSGQAGNGTSGGPITPASATPVTGITDATVLAPGQSTVIVLRTGGAVWGWGSNYYGTLGTTGPLLGPGVFSPYALTGP